MKILQTPTFIRLVKKLHPNQKKNLDKAVREIATNPEVGTPKVGDLAGVYIYKFKVSGLQWLFAYRVVSKSEVKLLVVGPHENFYRDLKKGQR